MRRSHGRVVGYTAALFLLLGGAVISYAAGLQYATISLVAGCAVVATLLMIAVHDDRDDRGSGPGGRGGRFDDRTPGRPIPIRIRSEHDRRR